MKRRASDIRKRVEKRRKERRQRYGTPQQELWAITDEQRYGQPVVTYDRYTFEEKHPLFSKEAFILKMLFSACLVLATAILFKNPSGSLEPARQFVKDTMEKEFQFATVSKWYEKQFGEPLAFIPTKTEKQIKTEPKQYAVPASGRVLESFQKNGQGVTVETASNAKVEAVNEGIVIFAGTKEKLGKTVIIQHADGSESWYGSLGSIAVKLYDFVETGKEVGTAMTNSHDQTKAVFYFAIKQGDHFIDPIQVISFE
ncbi:M23 family metallopeptidase [Parageobacillus thermoglucosidasius]|jgi:stage IV sporulation protein FA|uniref:Peptidase M23 n=1 Tax=Parageobacillus thermoglucosidasius TaxID=1426 RepID=A0A1B7KWG1_PARTM|nr:M23 family metallopeptidase [Parageobacillus thermoglucosidasius]OAT74367.1 peptidase M23 [Parageobacillus thermoglucosidasius]